MQDCTDFLRKQEALENVVLKLYVLRNRNKLCFTCISDLISLPLVRKGETFFHSKPQYFNFQSKIMVTLYNFFVTFPFAKPVVNMFIKLQQENWHMKTRIPVCMFPSRRLEDNTT